MIKTGKIPTYKRHACKLGLLLALLWAPLALASDAGWFGLGAEVKAHLTFRGTIVEAITITKTAPGSPAEKAGLAAGDAIIEMNGVAVAGAKSKMLQSMMDVTVGETLHLKLLRADGEAYTADLIAAPRPPSASSPASSPR